MFTFNSSFSVCVTARTDEQREYHFGKILAAITNVTGGATVNKTSLGYWGPTDEFEPSWEIAAFCENAADLLQSIADTLARYLIDARQEAALVVLDGRPFFIENLPIDQDLDEVTRQVKIHADILEVLEAIEVR